MEISKRGKKTKTIEQMIKQEKRGDLHCCWATTNNFITTLILTLGKSPIGKVHHKQCLTIS